MTRDLSRQGFLGPASEQVLAQSSIGIVGLCGGGSHVAQQLAHVGVGQFVLCDPDVVEESNLNRMVGATYDDVQAARLKVDVIARQLRAVNPGVSVIGVAEVWQSSASSLRDCTAVFGCVDSFLERVQLEAMCRRFLIPYFDIGMDVTRGGSGYVVSGQAIVSMPGHLCIRCIGFITDELLAVEAQQYGVAGARPQVVWPNGVLASTAVGMFMSTLTPWASKAEVPIFVEYDGNAVHVFASSRLKHLSSSKCCHFSGPDDIGDPFFGRNNEPSLV